VSDGDPATVTVPKGTADKVRGGTPLKVIERP
jgi:hypothetical protein